MAKKKIIRKSNRILNIFAEGGTTQNNVGDIIGTVGTSLGTVVNAGLQNAQIDSSSIEDEISSAKSYVVSANNNNDLMNEWGLYSPLENVSWKDIRGGSTGQRISNTLGAAGSGAAAGATVGGPIGAVIGGVAGLGSSLVGWLGGNRKAKKKAKKLNSQIDAVNTKNLAALNDRAESIDTQNDLLAMANYAAYGGKIHIKKSNRGKFTKYCGGKVTSECIAKGKRSSDPAVRKRAVFAQNARKFKHAYGGFLEGMEYDLDESTVKDLISKGYEIEYL